MALARTYNAAFYKPPKEDSLRRAIIMREIKAGHSYIFAVEGNVVLGFVSWRLESFDYRHRVAELFHIGVSPDAGRSGIGKQLVDKMEQDIHLFFRRHRLPGARRIIVKTGTENEGAHCFYEHCGYTFDGTVLRDHFKAGHDERQYSKNFE